MNSLSVQTLFATLFLSLCFTAAGVAQAPSDTLSLGEITVESTRFDTEQKKQPVSVTRFSADQLDVYGASDISAILDRRSSAVIGNYGPGGLSTLSMRGYSPGRTQVVWNNTVMNDPVNGVFDLSLMPSNFVRAMEVSAGNSSTAYGSGAAGGTLYLNSGMSQNRYAAWQELGSFGQNRQGATASYRSGSWYGGASFQRESSDNDFSYGEGETRTHNAIDGLHGMITAGYDTESLRVESLAWLYDVENQSPGSLYFPSETAVQDDRAFRWANRIDYRVDNSTFYSNIHYSNADTDFTDEAFGTESETNIRTVSNEVGWRQQWSGRFSTDQSALFSVHRVQSSNYEQDESQFNFAYRFNTELSAGESLDLFGGLRYDYYDVAGDAVSGSAGFNLNPYRDLLIVRGQYSRNFVAPTLNDLFWPNAGNPDLDPETSHKGELGILSLHENRFGSFQAEVNGFMSRQYDGIQWTFGDQGLAVRNVDEIFTRGAEASVKQGFKLAPSLQFHTEAGATYTRATIEENEEDPDAEGSQLVYVPEWSWRAHVSLAWQAVSAGIDYRYIGERETSENNELAPALESYATADLFARVMVPVGQARVNLTGRIHNVADREFQFIDGYPMPGRYFTVTARIDFTP
jgi:vitamin B12 transporter